MALQDSEVAREAWRSMKNNAVALSFGYLTKARESRPGGINALLEIDLFEITVAPGPINPETRFLSLKAATAERRVPTNAELVAQAKALGLEIPLSKAELRKRSDDVALEAALGFEPLPRPEPEPEDTRPTQAELRRKCDMLALEALMDGVPSDQPELETKRVSTDAELRAKCKALGFAVPAPRRDHAKGLDAVRADAKAHIITCLRGADQQAGGR